MAASMSWVLMRRGMRGGNWADGYGCEVIMFDRSQQRCYLSPGNVLCYMCRTSDPVESYLLFDEVLRPKYQELLSRIYFRLTPGSRIPLNPRDSPGLPPFLAIPLLVPSLGEISAKWVQSYLSKRILIRLIQLAFSRVRE